MIRAALNVLLLVLPVVIEWIRRERTPGEKAADYVRRVDREKVKTYEALKPKTGEAATKLSWDRIRLIGALGRTRLRPEVHEPKPGGSALPNGGTELPPSRA